LLIASGSEVDLCVKAKAVLAEQGIKARVVSMPCIEEYEKQNDAYKNNVIPKSVKARVCVEAASPHCWYRYAGDYGKVIAMNDFGASAPANLLFPHYGFTVENIVENAIQSMEAVKVDTQK